jgi:hypothetical protein
MIRAVAFCPHPPLLVPEVAQGAAPELDELRGACRTAIRRIASIAPRIVVVGPGPAWDSFEPFARGSLAGYGVPLEVALGLDEPGPVNLPLSLTIGAWLLRDALGPNCGATAVSIGPEQGVMGVFSGEEPTALLVMGDGSARRSTSAPGYFDDRAPGFDAQLSAALRSGKRVALQVDVHLGDELLATAPRVWSALVPRLDDASYTAELLYDAAPYGVGYFVAVWT